MKKVLLASTALIGFAGMAAAEVTISGSGRFGIVYTDDGTTSDTILSHRLRLNIDASTETDSGVKFGGRIRLQYDNGDTVDAIEPAPPAPAIGYGAAEVNAAMLYAETAGFRFELGNANTAFDSLATLYNAELGFIGTTTGSYSLFSFDSYSSSPYAVGDSNRLGLFASYSVGNLVARVSYIDYDQTGANANGKENETGIALDYTAGAYKLGFGYVTNAAGADGYDVWALLGEYALNDATNVGLQFIGEDGIDPDGFENNDMTYTLYGNTKLASGIGLSGFVSGVDSDATYVNDYAIGLGANYDIGGATIAGTIQQSFDDETYADLGISFSF
jgi:outer membrane protein OmpU